MNKKKSKDPIQKKKEEKRELYEEDWLMVNDTWKKCMLSFMGEQI